MSTRAKMICSANSVSIVLVCFAVMSVLSNGQPSSGDSEFFDEAQAIDEAQAMAEANMRVPATSQSTYTNHPRNASISGVDGQTRRAPGGHKVFYITTSNSAYEVQAGIPGFPKVEVDCSGYITLDPSTCITYPEWSGTESGAPETMCNAKSPGMSMMLFATSPKNNGMHYSDPVMARFLKFRFNLNEPEYFSIERRQTNDQRQPQTGPPVCRENFGVTNSYYRYPLISTQWQEIPGAEEGEQCQTKYGTKYIFERFTNPPKLFYAYWDTWDDAMGSTTTDIIVRCMD